MEYEDDDVDTTKTHWVMRDETEFFGRYSTRAEAFEEAERLHIKYDVWDDDGWGKYMPWYKVYRVESGQETQKKVRRID